MKKLLLICAFITTLIISGCEKESFITMEDAKNFALQSVDGEVIKETKDLDDDEPSYEFSIVANNQKYDIEIDAKTGDIISKELDEDYTPLIKPTQPDEDSHLMTKEGAQNLALTQSDGGNIQSIQLDHEDNHLNCKWEVEIVNGDIKHEIDLNARTGEVVKHEKESIYD